MAATKEMLDEADIAKTYVVNSDMADDQKHTYLKLINITTEATNGISPEEKIQKMTEAILLLAASQIKHEITLDTKISVAVQKANTRQCAECKAMKHADDVEEKQKQEELIEEWKKKNGICIDGQASVSSDSNSWNDIIKQILVKPYVYVFLSIAFLSPYASQILDKVFQFCSK